MDAVTYCSYATDEDGCLGVCILEGDLNPVQAALKAKELGISPGGQLLAVACNRKDPEMPPEEFAIMEANINRLIPPEEARTLFEAKSIKEFEIEWKLTF